MDSRTEWAARLCARLLSGKALMKRSPSPHTSKILYYWKQTAHKVTPADQGQLIILSSTITSQEIIANWPRFPLPSSCSIPAPLGLHCLQNPIRNFGRYHGSSSPQHTVLPSALQSFMNLGGKSCPELNCTKGKRPRKQVLQVLDGGLPPASLWATLTVTAATFSVMDPFLPLHSLHTSVPVLHKALPITTIS